MSDREYILTTHRSRTQRDKYSNFTELASNEQEGRDYRRLMERRSSKIAIIAPHGGGIEPGTSEITKALAGNEFSLYCFEGCKPRENETLHITSIHFDEPTCMQLVERSQIVVAVHACASEHEVAYVGGLEEHLKAQVIEALRSAEFEAQEDVSDHSGRDIRNICNRGISGRGLQIEIAEGLRRVMFEGLKRHERENKTPLFDKFVAAVREVLLKAQGGNTLWT